MIDPVSAALIAVAGATSGLTEVSKNVVYDSLKAAIQKRFGHEHALVKAVEAVEAKPTSQGRHTTLVEEITEAGADQDQALLALADHLLVDEVCIQHSPAGSSFAP